MKIFCRLLCLLLLLTSLSGCTQTQNKVETEPKLPILTLDFYLLDICTALELPVQGSAGNADGSFPNYLKDQLVQEPIFLGERKQPNLELILSQKPGAILVNPKRHQLILSELSSIAPSLSIQDHTLETTLKETKKLAQTFSKTERYQELDKELQEEIQQVKKLFPQGSTVLVTGSFDDDFSIWTKGSFIASLFQELGGEWPFEGLTSVSEGKAEIAKSTFSEIVKIDPDYLFIYGEGEKWFQDKNFQQLKAYQKQQVFLVDRNLWAKGRGPLAALAILAQLKELLADHVETTPQAP